jgi:hypothetical protein
MSYNAILDDWVARCQERGQNSESKRGNAQSMSQASAGL